MEFRVIRPSERYCQEAGRAILDIYQQDDVGIQTKPDQSPLTQADLASHDIITKALKQLTPDIPILSEEGHTLDGEVDTFWCVDPLMAPRSSLKRMMNLP
jgi:3'(2'), 5'-bisphosphate nucleotidase